MNNRKRVFSHYPLGAFLSFQILYVDTVCMVIYQAVLGDRASFRCRNSCIRRASPEFVAPVDALLAQAHIGFLKNISSDDFEQDKDQVCGD